MNVLINVKKMTDISMNSEKDVMNNVPKIQLKRQTVLS